MKRSAMPPPPVVPGIEDAIELETAIPSDYRLPNQRLQERLGTIYIIGWAVHDYHRRFQDTGNPLYAWHAITALLDARSREVIGDNAGALHRLRRSFARTKSTVRRREIAEEIEVREWIGEPLPDWVAVYLSRAGSALVQLEVGADGAHKDYPREVSRALELSPAGGGATAPARLARERVDRRHHFERFMERCADLGVAPRNEALADRFGVSVATIKSWKRQLEK